MTPSSNNNHHQLSNSSTTAAEDIIAEQIEGIQKMIRVRNIPEKELGIHINPAIKRHFELEIKVLREAPRDPDKLRKILKAKQRKWANTMKIEELQSLVTETEMLKFVLCVILNNKNNNNK